MNWADHCSSDEESDDGLHPARVGSDHPIEADLSNDLSYGSAEEDPDLELEKEKTPYPIAIDMNNLPEGFPTEAPYTAHVTNVAFNINTPEDFGQKIEGLVKYRYQSLQTVQVTGARFGIDRATGKKRGFGYVEFGTPEELMRFLNVGDGHSKIHGRIIGVNVAKPSNHNRRDNNRDNNRDNHRDHGDRGERTRGDHGERGERTRGDASDIDGSKFRGGFRNAGGRNNEQKERSSLKLAPRSKPDDDKPSSEANWRSGPGNRDSGDRGGRGRGRGRGRQAARGGGRGNVAGKKNPRNNEKDNNKEASADGWDSAPKTAKPVAAAPVAVKEEKKKVTKVANAFAAFGFDSDSD